MKTLTEFKTEIPLPGTVLEDCRETWRSLSTEDKFKLCDLFGIDHVLRIEQLMKR